MTLGEVQTTPVMEGFEPDLRLTVALEELWGTANGDVVLKASWTFVDSEGACVAQGNQNFVKKGWKVGNYENLAANISALMPSLAKAIEASLEAGKVEEAAQ